MRTTTLLLPLALAFSTNAISINLGPDIVCGPNANDCGNGFCCAAAYQCNTTGAATRCGDKGSALPFDLGSIASAEVSAGVSYAQSAINNIPSQAASWVNGLPSSIIADVTSFLDSGSLPTGSALSSWIDSFPSSARGEASSFLNSWPTELGGRANSSASASGSVDPKNSEGGAAMVGGGGASYVSTVAVVAGIWGVAAVGGAMLVL